MIVGVLVQLSNRNIDKVFDYLIPKELEQDIKIGIRVEVPFGYQKLEGFILEIKKESTANLKKIISIIDKDIVLNDELLNLGKTMQKNTLSTLISCYQVMLPKALKAKHGNIVTKKYDIYYKIKDIPDKTKLNENQQKIIDLFNDKKLVPRKDILNISSSSLNTLIKKDILIEEKLEHYRINYNNDLKKKYPLTKEQEQAVSSVVSGVYKPYLLYGVTGSGKTEVYMELIESVINNGKQAIVLVPEISLTPQMVSRFEERFGNRIAALHSALSEGEKYDEWRRITREEVDIVIGARSAIFAPFKKLGIIIMDEEHSDSYKQDNNPRYHARDIALIRGNYHNCPVMMGSATPTLESMARAKKNVYSLLELPNRVNGKSLPEVNIIDLNSESKKNKYNISTTLLKEINETLNKSEQVILFLNRRGFSTFITCKNCSYTYRCPNCDITLTYHKSNNVLRCHYCGYATKVDESCPECKEKSLSNLGVGTEKIEEELHHLIPSAKVLRMDIDTTSRKGMHYKMINAFKNHEYDILLGTQIVAKGLDFSNVTLVGVINADTSLNIPDFRSSENTFSLLSQVSGRSGRSNKEGRVFIQTFNPSHYAIDYVKKHDYLGFYNKEMQIRRMLKYPPFYYLCYIKISGKDMNYIGLEANKIKKSLDRLLSQMFILGPSTCSVFKVNNIYRYGIIIKYFKEDNLYEVLTKMIDHYKSNSNIRIDIDFNPTHL